MKTFDLIGKIFDSEVIVAAYCNPRAAGFAVVLASHPTQIQWITYDQARKIVGDKA